jgi:hypothetical protein
MPPRLPIFTSPTLEMEAFVLDIAALRSSLRERATTLPDTVVHGHIAIPLRHHAGRLAPGGRDGQAEMRMPTLVP